jgi:serine/threonine protein kinase/Flp pilus assembly protein TadD
MGLDEAVDAYEESFSDDPSVRLEDFVPPPGDPNRGLVLAELIRVDLELRWKRGIPCRLGEYRNRFPEEFQQDGFSAPLAFEEYRVRLLLGDSVRRSEYAENWGCDVSSWPEESVAVQIQKASQQKSNMDSAIKNLRARQGDSATSPQSADGVVKIPVEYVPSESSEKRGGRQSGSSSRSGTSTDAVSQAIYFAHEELGFEIVEQLGKGASARVYLARQPSLADRLVVLKFTTESTVEGDRLARLQHTNIVPLYSYHEVGSMQVLCMPFLGRYVLKEWVDQLHVLGDAPESNEPLVSTLRETVARSKRAALEHQSRTVERLLDSRPSIDSVDRPFLETTSRLARNPSREAGLLRLQGNNYSETVLWIASRLASGMGHAHDHGILHLDIKPGNILITDDGQPMLLDFHLSTLRSGDGPATTVVGGTLPYMSPEQILAFQDKAVVDERSDVYSLGVVLFELLSGRLPFVAGRAGTSRDDLTRMLEIRTTVPLVRTLNRGVSPATEAIVRRCLAYRPEDRYQSAHELAHDLNCQLQHLPLQHAGNPSVRELLTKWVSRHPRVMSAGGIATVAAIAIGTVGTTAAFRGHKLAENAALMKLNHFSGESPKIQSGLSLVSSDYGEAAKEINAAVALLEETGFSIRRILESATSQVTSEQSLDSWRQSPFYQFLSPSQQRQLDHSAAELLFLLAEVVANPQSRFSLEGRGYTTALDVNLLALSCFRSCQAPKAIWEQRSRLYEKLGDHRQAQEATLQFQVGDTLAESNERFDVLAQLINRDQQSATESLSKLTQDSPQDLSLWFFSGNNQSAGLQLNEAEASYTACIALNPLWYRGWFHRGTVRMVAGQFQKACDDFSRSLELMPAELAALWNRALCFESMGRIEEALADLNLAMTNGFPQTRIYFFRARLFDKLNRPDEAAADRQEGINRTPADVDSWLARGTARSQNDPLGAMADFEEAIRLQPGNSVAHRNLALLLAENLHREDDALEVLDEFLKTQNVTDGYVWLGRGVFLARRGKMNEARDDARRGLKLTREPLAVYQAACIEALDPQRDADGTRRCLELLAEAFQANPKLAELALRDGDLNSLHDMRLFKDLNSIMRFIKGSKQENRR